MHLSRPGPAIFVSSFCENGVDVHGHILLSAGQGYLFVKMCANAFAEPYSDRHDLIFWYEKSREDTGHGATNSNSNNLAIFFVVKAILEFAKQKVDSNIYAICFCKIESLLSLDFRWLYIANQ